MGVQHLRDVTNSYISTLPSSLYWLSLSTLSSQSTRCHFPIKLCPGVGRVSHCGFPEMQSLISIIWEMTQEAGVKGWAHETGK